ncbi:MAG: sugar phosphate isomerase/epimerase family protein [Bacteroidota bacterium]
MKNSSRREFIKSSVGLMAISQSIPFLDWVKNNAKLSFSTLGCPDWTFDKILEVASKNGYKGIEIRGIQRQLDLPLCPEFANEAAIKLSNQKIKDKNLLIVDLGSSANLHFADATKRKENLGGAKRFIELAEKIHCPFVRVFPNDLPKDQEEKQTIDLIISGLNELGDFAKGSGVKVLLESHGKVIYKDLLLKIMQASESNNVGLIWDVWNMWSVTKEPVAQVYETLKKYILHTHIKDGIFENEKPKYVLLGQGVSPLVESIALLQKGGYQGYYSFEWEKMWHPEIEDPEIAIPHYAENFGKLFF